LAASGKILFFLFFAKIFSVSSSGVIRPTSYRLLSSHISRLMFSHEKAILIAFHPHYLAAQWLRHDAL
jgi:hypothetical protein